MACFHIFKNYLYLNKTNLSTIIFKCYNINIFPVNRKNKLKVDLTLFFSAFRLLLYFYSTLSLFLFFFLNNIFLPIFMNRNFFRSSLFWGNLNFISFSIFWCRWTHSLSLFKSKPTMSSFVSKLFFDVFSWLLKMTEKITLLK